MQSRNLHQITRKQVEDDARRMLHGAAIIETTERHPLGAGCALKPLYHTEIRLPLLQSLYATTILNCDRKNQFAELAYIIDGSSFTVLCNYSESYPKFYFARTQISRKQYYAFATRWKGLKIAETDGLFTLVHNNISPRTCVIIVGAGPQLVEILVKWIFLRMPFKHLTRSRISAPLYRYISLFIPLVSL